MKKASRLLLASLFLVAVFSCSGKPPSLANLKWYIVDRPLDQKKEPGQSMSLFAAVQDPDGIDDIEEFYLINDSSRLYWKLTSDTWEKKEQDGNRWIGSNGFTLPSGGIFPDGSYRVLIVDSGGDSAERVISVNQSSKAPIGAMSVKLENDLLDVQGPFPTCQLLVLDANGQAVLSLSVKSGQQSYRELVSAFPESALGRSIVGLSVSEGTNQASMSRRVFLP
jgi:hypothetical protein